MLKFTTLLILLSCCSCFNTETETLDEDQTNYCTSHCDLSKTTSVQFLKSLKKTFDCKRHFVVCDPIENWITQQDISSLIPYLDSNDVIATPVFSATASFTTGNHGQSTLATEAYSLINGYRNGRYPPYCTIPLGGDQFDTFKLEDSLKTEVLNWWNKEARTKNSINSKDNK